MALPWLERVSLCAVLVATSGCVLRTIEDFSEQDSEGAEDSTTDDAMATTVGPVTSADSTTDPPQPQPGLSHQIDIQPIWNVHCVEACHSTGGEWQFLDLANAYENIVGINSTQATSMSFIEPGAPDSSYLWHKINDTQAQAGGGGLPMPKGPGSMDPTVLSPDELALIEQWILEGALP